MLLVAYKFPEPKTIGSLEPEFFKEVKDIVEENTRYIGGGSLLRFRVEDGNLNLSSSYSGQNLTEHAKYLSSLVMPYAPKAGVIEVMINYNEGHPREEFWHRDGMKRSGVTVVASDKNPTIFAYGERLTFNDIKLAKAKRLASKLTIFRPNPYELTLFNRKTLHTRPAEDLKDRTFIRVVAE